MMGFTFIVGIGFAYVLKTLTLFFSRLSGEALTATIQRSKVWRRAYRMDISRTYRYIRSITRTEAGFAAGSPQNRNAEGDTAQVMGGLAEYHFGSPESTQKQDPEMKHLYELHHGTI